MDKSARLPSYFPSQPTPSYTHQPRPDEERLAITGENERARLPRGTFRVSSKNSRNAVTLELDNQEENASIPCFDKDAVIRGRIQLHNWERVQRVVVELEGHLKISIAEGGNKTRPLFRIAHVIWERDKADTQCPQTHEFLCPLPNSYSTSSGMRPLPPSFQVIFPGVPGLFANTFYTISVHVSRVWKIIPKPILTLSTPMKYYPRTTAPRVIKNSVPFFSLIKTAPEEYYQVVATMRSRPGSGFAPIHCLLFVPSTCTYALNDEIPFHVQLTAPLSSLLAFAQSSSCSGHARSSTTTRLLSERRTTEHMDARPLVRSSSSTSASMRSSFATGISRAGRNNMTKYSVRVFLLRQIIVEVRGQRAWRTSVLGESKLTPSPPGHSPPCTYPYAYTPQRQRSQNQPEFFSPSSSSSSLRPTPTPQPAGVRRLSTVYSRFSGLGGYVFGSNTGSKNITVPASEPQEDPGSDPIESLDWDGTVRVNNPTEIQTGGFAAGCLVVKDFIVLELQPPDPSKNPLIALQHTHPIKLVTDAYEDTWT